MSARLASALIGHTESAAIVAWRLGRAITVAELLRDIDALAARLPEHRYLLNLCQDRYRFFVTFGAALVRGATSLFPPNHTEQVLADVTSAYPECMCVTEGPRPPAHIPTLDYPESLGADVSVVAHELEIPLIANDFGAALVFTSGSTGAPRPNLKTWGKLVAGAHAEAKALGLSGSFGLPFNVLGTVPPQHMYGFESTVFLPLMAGGSLHASRPLFAADVQRALAEMPAPRVLVTTPIHIRACIEDAVQLPPLELIVSAAAPLAIDLAQRAEMQFSTRLLEIYGFTEAGMVASRHTTASLIWDTMDQVALTSDETGWGFEGGHVHDRVAVTDVIRVDAPGRFTLEGRARDMVNIAGKRTSLADLNHKLNAIPGVQDGVFHVPTGDSDAVARLMAFVVAPDLSEAQILEALRKSVDPAFLPRPLVKVTSLLRAATGKLPLEALRALEADVER